MVDLRSLAEHLTYAVLKLDELLFPSAGSGGIDLLMWRSPAVPCALAITHRSKSLWRSDPRPSRDIIGRVFGPFRLHETSYALKILGPTAVFSDDCDNGFRTSLISLSLLQ